MNTPIYSLVYQDYSAPRPNLSSRWSEANPVDEIEGDYYVSTDGDDSNVGDKEHPFKTIQKAKEVVKAVDKTDRDSIIIGIEEGEYPVNNLRFEYEDSGTEDCQIIYQGLGDVVFNSGRTLPTSSFKNAEEYPNIKNRLNDDAKKHAKILDLTSVGISKEAIGKMYAYGSYNTSAQYEGDTTGPLYAELFINEKRMEIARYPNVGYLKTDEVVFSSRDQGVTLPNGDPKGDVYKANDELASRIKSWQSLDDVWMYGFFMYDWADQATSIFSFDESSNELTTKYFSFFGAR
ncbi:MAG: hypothetical protein J5736_06090, partial [Bacilli bacterium]|nr:hypothetical protein [Bacilli bacterium]